MLSVQKRYLVLQSRILSSNLAQVNQRFLIYEHNSNGFIYSTRTRKKERGYHRRAKFSENINIYHPRKDTVNSFQRMILSKRLGSSSKALCTSSATDKLNTSSATPIPIHHEETSQEFGKTLSSSIEIEETKTMIDEELGRKIIEFKEEQSRSSSSNVVLAKEEETGTNKIISFDNGKEENSMEEIKSKIDDSNNKTRRKSNIRQNTINDKIENHVKGTTQILTKEKDDSESKGIENTNLPAVGENVTNSEENNSINTPSPLAISRLVKDYVELDYSNANDENSSLILGTGLIANQVKGCIVGSHGDTVVLSTVVSNPPSSDGPPPDFMPLVVEYREKAHAYGEIPRRHGGKDGPQSDEETLSSRVIDRVIRPLFPKNFANDTQIIATCHSYDWLHNPTSLAVNATSSALSLATVQNQSMIWDGPVGCVRVGHIDGRLVLWPKDSDMKKSRLDMTYAANEKNTLMIEAFANQLPEDEIVRALQFAHHQCQPLIQAQRELTRNIQNNMNFTNENISKSNNNNNPDHDILKDIWEEALKLGYNRARGVFSSNAVLATTTTSLSTKAEISREQAQLQGDIMKGLNELFPNQILYNNLCAEEVVSKALRDCLLEIEGQCQSELEALSSVKRKHRADGRTVDEIRPIHCLSGVLPSTVHGSSLFTRGETQSLCTVTLGPDDSALLPRFGTDKLNRTGIDLKKKFFLQYDFPPYCTNESGKVFGSNRRMIGHGALAERALLPVIPTFDEFPYTIKVSSEVTSSNGSSSMATTCGGSMALMDAGVPIKEHIAGISVGLLTPHKSPVTGSTTSDTEKGASTTVQKSHQLLLDILGLEDHYGDMDFKIAGSRKGVTAIQLDVKLTGGVPLPTLIEGIYKGKEGRLRILDHMYNAIESPKSSMSPNAPRVFTMPFNRAERAQELRMDTIRSIEEAYPGVKVGFPDDKTISILGYNTQIPLIQEFIQRKLMSSSSDNHNIATVDVNTNNSIRDGFEDFTNAKEHVYELLSEIVTGENYIATVEEVRQFGVVLDVMRGKTGILHISEFTDASNSEAERKMQELEVGQKIKVKCLEVDEVRGYLRLSRKAILEEEGKSEKDGFEGGTTVRAGSRSSPTKQSTSLSSKKISLKEKQIVEIHDEEQINEVKQASKKERKRRTRKPKSPDS